MDATLKTRPEISPATKRGGTEHMDSCLGKTRKKTIGSRIGDMLQAEKIQHLPSVTPSSQVGHSEFYSDWELTELVGVIQVLHREWDPNNLGQVPNFQGMC